MPIVIVYSAVDARDRARDRQPYDPVAPQHFEQEHFVAGPCYPFLKVVPPGSRSREMLPDKISRLSQAGHQSYSCTM